MHKVIDAEKEEEEGGGNFHPLHLSPFPILSVIDESEEKRYKEFFIINEEKKRRISQLNFRTCSLDKREESAKKKRISSLFISHNQWMNIRILADERAFSHVNYGISK